jgi:uncharacterized membrane protein SirB2
VSYALLKIVHMSCAGISYALFVLRGVWRFTGSPIADRRWTRVVPHVNDTVLLLAALAMAASLAPFPGYHPFLAAKLGGLILYILLGVTAFRWAQGRSARLAAWLAAQAVFFYIVAVALTKSPGAGLIG